MGKPQVPPVTELNCRKAWERVRRRPLWTSLDRAWLPPAHPPPNTTAAPGDLRRRKRTIIYFAGGRRGKEFGRVGGGWGGSSQLNAQGFHSHAGPASRACGFGWVRASSRPPAVNNSCGQRSRKESGGCSLLHLARQSRPLLRETSRAAQGARCCGPSSGQAGAPRILFRPPGPP